MVFRDIREHQGTVFHRAERGDLRVSPSLKTILEDEQRPAIVRATALSLYGQSNARDLAQTAAMALGSKDPMVRASAVRVLSGQSPQQRFLMLRTLIDDPVLAIRMSVAEQLADAPMNELRPKDIAQLDPLFKEYLAVQSQHLEMPSVQLQLSNFYRARGDLEAAEKALREAIHINPELQPAIINLSDLLRSSSRDAEARALLESKTQLRESAPYWHALGLLEIRAGNREQAIKALKKAADLETEGTRYRYVYAVALHDTGNPAEAMKVLEKANIEQPGNPEVLYTLVGYANETGDTIRMGKYRAQLQEVGTALGYQ